MLYGIIVNVVAVPLEVFLVLNAMLPEAPLPDPPAPILVPRVTDRLLRPTFRYPGFREFLFDPRPAERILGITAGQRPDRMQVVRKEDDGLDSKRPPTSAVEKGLA